MTPKSYRTTLLSPQWELCPTVETAITPDQTVFDPQEDDRWTPTCMLVQVGCRVIQHHLTTHRVQVLQASILGLDFVFQNSEECNNYLKIIDTRESKYVFVFKLSKETTVEIILS